MKTYRVKVSDPAISDLEALYDYIAGQDSAAVAEGYVARINARLARLGRLPHIGTRIDPARAGLREVGFERRIVIQFLVDDDAETVSVLGVYYGGRRPRD